MPEQSNERVNELHRLADMLTHNAADMEKGAIESDSAKTGSEVGDGLFKMLGENQRYSARLERLAATELRQYAYLLEKPQ